MRYIFRAIATFYFLMYIIWQLCNIQAYKIVKVCTPLHTR